MDEDHVVLGVLPYFHAYAFNLYNGAIILNKKLIILDKFNEKVFLNAIEKYKVTYTPLVPPILVLLAKSPLVDHYDLSSLKEILYGAAPLNKDIDKQVEKR